MRVPIALLLLCTVGCTPEPAAEAADAPAAEAVPASTAPEDNDPCRLVPVEEWTKATGYTDIVTDRSERDTCDFLSDDFFGVVGSVLLVDRAFLDYMERRTENAERVSGVGDEALSVPLGIIVRAGDRFLMVTVNPQIEKQPQIARDLARIAIANL